MEIKTGLHRKLHTDQYYGWANSVVISAYNSAQGNAMMQRVNVVKALGILRNWIKSNGCGSSVLKGVDICFTAN